MTNGTSGEILEPYIFSALRRLHNFLRPAGISSFIVGGLVRDLILKRKTADIDLAVPGDALIIAREVARFTEGTFVLLDEAKHIGRVVLADKTGLSGRARWTLDFTTIEGTIYDDLARRDFTIDAMAYDLAEFIRDPEQAWLIDPFGGLNDLHDRIIRAVGNTVFTEDPLRLLRAFRLAAELGFTLDSETEFLVKSDAYLIATVAGERIREELLRLLLVPKLEILLLDMSRLGLLTALIPELAGTRGIAQPKEHYWPVFEHLVATAAAAAFLLRCGDWEYTEQEVLRTVPWTGEVQAYFSEEVNQGSTRGVLLNLAALLHDIAKPETRMVDDKGRLRFYGHSLEGAGTTVEIMERLRFSTREIKLVTAMVQHHMRPGQLAPGTELPSARAIYRYFRDTGEAGLATVYLNLADHLAARGPKLETAAWEEHTRVATYIINEHFNQTLIIKQERLVDGHDLIKELGLVPGPELGAVLDRLLEEQAAGEIKTRAAALQYARKLLTPGRKDGGTSLQ